LEKEKDMKMELMLLPIICLVATMGLAGSAEAFAVKGEIKFSKKGTIFVTLVDQTQFAAETLGLGLILPVGTEEEKAGRLSFEFQDVPPGTYAIKAFQDVNGNGVLDIGAFGPKEPWGMYRDARPTFRAPNWDEVKFDVDRDLQDIQINLKK